MTPHPTFAASPLASSGTRTALIAVAAVLVLLGLLLIWRGARRRGSVPDEFGDLPAPPADTGPPFGAPLKGLYLGTADAGERHPGESGDAGRADGWLQVTERGVRFDRAGAPSVWVPREALRGARLDRAHPGKVGAHGRMVVVAWAWGGHELETAFRGIERARQPKVVRSVHAILGPGLLDPAALDADVADSGEGLSALRRLRRTASSVHPPAAPTPAPVSADVPTAVHLPVGPEPVPVPAAAAMPDPPSGPLQVPGGTGLPAGFDPVTGEFPVPVQAYVPPLLEDLAGEPDPGARGLFEPAHPVPPSEPAGTPAFGTRTGPHTIPPPAAAAPPPAAARPYAGAGPSTGPHTVPPPAAPGPYTGAQATAPAPAGPSTGPQAPAAPGPFAGPPQGAGPYAAPPEEADDAYPTTGPTRVPPPVLPAPEGVDESVDPLTSPLGQVVRALRDRP